MEKKCPICSSNNGFSGYIFEKNNFKKCLNCGSLFSRAIYNTKDLEKTYNDVYFREDYKKGGGFDYFSNKEEKIKSFLEKLRIISEFIFPFKNLEILDIGCAAGYFLEVAKRNGFNVYGIEISKEASAFANKEFGIKIIAPDLLSISSENKYDVITMFQVLEHLPFPKEQLMKVYDLLKPGGILFIEVPNFFSVDTLFDFEIKKRVFSVPYHLSLFSPRGLKQLINSVGFKIIEQRFYFSSVIGCKIKKILNVLKPYFELRTKEMDIKKNSQILNRSFPRSFYKKIISYILPGSNMMIVCKKDKIN